MTRPNRLGHFRTSRPPAAGARLPESRGRRGGAGVGDFPRSVEHRAAVDDVERGEGRGGVVFSDAQEDRWEEGRVIENVVLYGDCLDVMPTLEAGSIDLIASDLPYGTTACAWDVVIPFEPLWENYRRVLKPNGAVVLTACQPFTSMLVVSNQEWFRHEWVWNKVQPTGHLDALRRPLRVCETVLVFSQAGTITYNPQMGAGRPINRTRGGKQTEVYGDFACLGKPSDTTRFPTNLLTISAGRSPHNRTVHPTQKPVPLFEYLIRTYSNPGDLVLDNCLGSGTTALACLNAGRRFIGIEKDRRFYELSLRRIERPHAPRLRSEPTEAVPPLFASLTEAS